MGQTQTARALAMREDEAAGLVAPDRSVTVWTDRGGWSVVRLTTAGDVRREAYLMRNCLAKYVSDTLDGDRMWVMTERSPMADEAPMELLADVERRRHSLPDAARYMRLHSLRDDLGVPRLTFWAQPGVGAMELYGTHNCEMPDAHRKVIERWACETLTFIPASAAHGHDLIVAVNTRCTLGYGEIDQIEDALRDALDSERRDERRAWLLGRARDAMAALWDIKIVADGHEALVSMRTEGGVDSDLPEELLANFRQRIDAALATVETVLGELGEAAQPMAA
jgi:hypothetical protein